MYPRLNPKVKRAPSENKQKLSILNDQNMFLPQSHRESQYYNDCKNMKQLPAIKESCESKNYCNRSLFDCQSKDLSIYTSCQNELNQKYNHLKGKRRSQQMSIIFYRQISEQKSSRNSQKRSSNEKRFNSLRKIQVNMLQKKKQFNKLSQRNYSKEKQQNQNLSSQDSYRLPKKIYQPLGELKNQVRYQNQEYQKYKKCHNFLPKVMKKGTFFRNKIIQQIITNNIDEWKSDSFQDEILF